MQNFKLSFVCCCILILYAENVCEFVFQPLSIPRKFILYVCFYMFICFVCNTMFPWQSASSSYYRYESLSHSPPQQNFRQLFFVSGKCEVTPHHLFHDLSTLIIVVVFLYYTQREECSVWFVLYTYFFFFFSFFSFFL